MGSKSKLVKRMWTLETITVVGKKLDLSDLVRVLSFKETDPHPPPHKCFPWGLRSAFNESQRRANWIFIVTFNFQFSIVNLDRTQMWGDWVFIATSCLDMFPAMCAPADISFYSIFQVAPNKMSKHNMSTCWNIHSGPKANFEIELEPICYCSLHCDWKDLKKEIISTSLKQIVIELLTTGRFHHHHCHTINIWLICRFQFIREKDVTSIVEKWLARKRAFAKLQISTDLRPSVFEFIYKVSCL